MYVLFLTIHSWLRWIALALGFCATVNALRDRLEPSERPPGARWDTFLMLAVDLQVLVGLFLYFGLSPYTKAAMENVNLALFDPALRFWGLEHIGLMAAAVVLVRMGRVMAITARTPAVRRSR